MSVMNIPWGVAHTFHAPILKAGSLDYAHTADWTPAAGDVMVSKDGGAFANIATLPAFIAGSGTLTWKLSAAECEATEIIIQVIDKAGTKKVHDQMFRLQTTKAGALFVGHVGAYTAAATTITLAATPAPSTVTDFYNGAVVTITNGTGANQARIITAYNGATRVATLDSAFATAPVAGDNVAMFAQGLLPNASATQTQAAVTTALTTYGASTLTSAQVGTALTTYGASTLTAAQLATALTTYGVSTVTAAQVATAVLGEAVETGYSLKSMIRIMSSILLGKVSGVGTVTETWRNVTDTKNRVTVTFPSATNGNRTNITYDTTD